MLQEWIKIIFHDEIEKCNNTFYIKDIKVLCKTQY